MTRGWVSWAGLGVGLVLVGVIGCSQSRLERECKEGNAASCEELGGKLLDSSDAEKRARGEQLLLQACALGRDTGCRRWTTLQRSRMKLIPRADLELLAQGCQLGASEACEFAEATLVEQCGDGQLASCRMLMGQNKGKMWPISKAG